MIKLIIKMIKDTFKKIIGKTHVKKVDIEPENNGACNDGTETYIKDPDFSCPEYIEVDMMNPLKDIEKKKIKINKTGLCMKDIHILPNDLIDFGDYMYIDENINIWVGKRVGEGEIIVVGPKYYIENKKNTYHIVRVKVYNSKNDYYNHYNSYISYISGNELDIDL